MMSELPIYARPLYSLSFQEVWSLHYRIRDFFRQLTPWRISLRALWISQQLSSHSAFVREVLFKGIQMLAGKIEGFKQVFFLLSTDEVDIFLQAGKEFRMNLSVFEDVSK